MQLGCRYSFEHLSVKGLEILPELSAAVALADLNAEALLVCYVGSQATETLAAAASHSHQQGIAAWLHQDSVDAADMQNGIPAAVMLQVKAVTLEKLHINGEHGKLAQFAEC